MTSSLYRMKSVLPPLLCIYQYDLSCANKPISSKFNRLSTHCEEINMLNTEQLISERTILWTLFTKAVAQHVVHQIQALSRCFPESGFCSKFHGRLRNDLLPQLPVDLFHRRIFFRCRFISSMIFREKKSLCHFLPLIVYRNKILRLRKETAEDGQKWNVSESLSRCANK